MLDDVHGGHREARAVDEAGDVSIELDVVESVFARFDFERRFLGQVAHLLKVRVAIERVVIEADLGVHGHQPPLAVAVLHQAKRVDLDDARVAFPPGLVNAGKKFRRGIDQVAIQAQRNRQFAPLVGH